MKVCVEVLEKLLWFQDEKTLRVGATDLSKKESFVARNGGFCIFAAVQSRRAAHQTDLTPLRIPLVS